MSEPEPTKPAPFMLVLLILAMLLQALLTIFAPMGCASTGPPPPAPPVQYGVARCEGFVPDPTDIDVCEGRFTADGLACVRCQVSAGCLHGGAVVYCTPACSDPACGYGGRR